MRIETVVVEHEYDTQRDNSIGKWSHICCIFEYILALKSPKDVVGQHEAVCQHLEH